MKEFDSLFGSESEAAEEEVSTDTEALEAEVEETVQEVVEEAVKETVEETAEETEATPEIPVVEEASTVPLAALHSEREKLKTSKAEADALRQQIAEMKAAAQNSADRPDPYDDPEGYASFVEQRIAQQVEQKLIERKFEDARSKAIEDHGEEFVQELGDWADQYAMTVDPQVGLKALASPDPVQFIINLKKRHESIREFEADEEAFIRARAIAMGFVPAASAVAVEVTQPTPKKPVGPKSIATVSNRNSNNSGAASLDDIF